MHTDKDSNLFTVISSLRIVVHCMGERAIRDKKHTVQIQSSSEAQFGCR